MAEPLVVSTLRTKRDQIEGRIAHLEDRLKEARTDLAHVTV
jgi:BMFP domain-containing protein YqiC